jgi:hypothetical protein
MDVSEKNFETTIQKQLSSSGYVKRNPKLYDRALCFDPEALFGIIYATQPEAWRCSRFSTARRSRSDSSKGSSRRSMSVGPSTCCAGA